MAIRDDPSHIPEPIDERTSALTQAFASGPLPPTCTVFLDDRFQGPSFVLYGSDDPSIVRGWRSLGDLNDKISSIVVESGFWAFYQDVDFNSAGGNPTGGFVITMATGSRSSLGTQNDHVSSIKASLSPFNP